MNSEIKKLWVDALRSGEYIQGKGQLKNEDNQFCCLGVLCDLHRKLNPENKWNSNEYFETSTSLPLEVVEWAGLERSNPYLNQASCVGLNDCGFYTFEVIANFIEKEL